MIKSTEKNARTNNAKSTTQKNEKHDECHRNSNIISKREDIIDILIHKTQKEQKCVFSHDAQI